MSLAFDFHIHSCLSPCAGDDMTPANIAGMCALAGMHVVALTDHNTCGNCGAFCRAAEAFGLVALPGMELTTREEVHVVCLFARLEQAMDFSSHVMSLLPPIANKAKVFGHQILMDEEDQVVGEETHLLAGAADIPLSQVAALVRSYGGFAYPAHIDRPSNSLLSQLGFWSGDLGFTIAEISRYCPKDLFQRPDLQGLRHIKGCDAHDLDRIPDPIQYMDLPEPTPEAALHWLETGN